LRLLNGHYYLNKQQLLELSSEYIFAMMRNPFVYSPIPPKRDLHELATKGGRSGRSGQIR